jgi:hypothetical protein
VRRPGCLPRPAEGQGHPEGQNAVGMPHVLACLHVTLLLCAHRVTPVLLYPAVRRFGCLPRPAERQGHPEGQDAVGGPHQ